MKYLIYYIILIVAVFLVTAIVKKHVDKDVEWIKIEANTSAFNTGDIVILDENGIRAACTSDSTACVVGFVTVKDSIGEILLKMEKNN